MTSQTTSRASRRMSRDTGFPEPFDKGSNTTLPHPDANLSPDACIDHHDLAGDHALKRKRLSFLNRKNKRSISHGYITPQSELVSSIMTLSLGEHDNTAHKEVQSPHSLARASTTSFRSKDGSESVDSMKKFEDTPPSSPDSAGPSSPKKGSVFSKWRR